MDNELKEALLTGKEMANYEPMKDVLLPSNIKATINKKDKTVKYYFVDDRGKKKLIDLKTKTVVNKPVKEATGKKSMSSTPMLSSPETLSG